MRTRPTALRVSFGLVVATLVLSGFSVSARQISAGMLATSKDLDTWTNYYDDSRQTEKGLSLVLGGKGGEMRLSFSARLEGRFPKNPPASVRLQASADPRINPNTQRTPALEFLVDAKEKKPWSIDLTSELTVDNPAPGAMVNDAIGHIRGADFTRLVKAKTIRANIFMVDVEFRQDQIRALEKYADSIFLKEK
jgi:hypothetical protein